MTIEEETRDPVTLGEYLDWAESDGVQNNSAAAFLRRMIDQSIGGRAEIPRAPALHMKRLISMMMNREEDVICQRK